MPIKKLKKGENLFSEGDTSQSMYYVQSGSIRLYKKKGNSAIELGTIHKGDVIGEMGFLDGGPRSASAEAIYDTELMEVTNHNLKDQLKVLPQWLLVLLKTVVNRLRSANTKIKQLETAGSQIVYGREGPASQYAFLPQTELIKLCLGLVYVGSRHGKPSEDGGITIKQIHIIKYCSQILNLNQSKVLECLGVFEDLNIISEIAASTPGQQKQEYNLKDIDGIDKFITFLYEESLKENSKRLELSARSLKALEQICTFFDKYPPSEEGIAKINFADIAKTVKERTEGKINISADDFSEIVKNKLATELAVVDNNTILSNINAWQAQSILKNLNILQSFARLNETKRKKVA